MRRAISHLILMSACLAACAPPPREAVRTEPPPVILPANVAELTPDEADRLIAASPGLVILDVRGEDESQAEGYIAGSQRFDYLNREQSFPRLEQLDRQAPYLLYCAIGGRAKLTAAHMHDRGFTRLSLLKGGLNAWIAEGKQVEK